jgi:hypothetical protein
MKNKTNVISALIPAIVIAGCAPLNTRPGHPDSWNTTYYKPDLEWKTIGTPGMDLSQAKATAPSATPVYQTAKTPAEIWQARGYAWNMHLRYQAAAYKAQDVQDELAVPVFGAAIATIATGLARASTVAVAATGLGGASLGAGASYLHPDKDAATDQAATSALLCVIDQSKILNDMSAIPLVLDKAALQDALSQMRQDLGPLLTGASSNQQAKAAVQAVETAAESSIKALDAAIAAYVAVPSEIFLAADTIDQAAKTSGARTLDYSSLLKSLQTSATNQSATDKAKTDVQTASDATASAKLPGGNGSTGASTQTLEATASVVKQALTEPAAGQAADTATATATTAATQTKQDALSSVLKNTGIADLTRVNLLAKAALDDIPNPNFSDAAASIKSCAALK